MAPLELSAASVLFDSHITLTWRTVEANRGLLPFTAYSLLLIKPDSSNTTVSLSPTALSHNFTLTPGVYSIGQALTFKLLVENAIGKSPYS